MKKLLSLAIVLMLSASFLFADVPNPTIESTATVTVNVIQALEITPPTSVTIDNLIEGQVMNVADMLFTIDGEDDYDITVTAKINSQDATTGTTPVIGGIADMAYTAVAVPTTLVSGTTGYTFTGLQAQAHDGVASGAEIFTFEVTVSYTSL